MNHQTTRFQAKELAANAIDTILDDLTDLDRYPTPTEAIVWFEPILVHLIFLFLISQEPSPKEAHQKS